MAARLLFVFAKEPRPGSVKTRMCPPLDAEQAARCHAAFLSDVLARMKAGANAHLVLAATPDGDAPALERAARSYGVELAWQGPGDLGRRMVAAFERARHERAVAAVIGSDSPDLPVAYVNAAFERAEAGCLVLGPCADGGFYLVASSGVPALADWDVTWGEPDVLVRTMAGAGRAGWKIQLLPSWYDIDDIASLRRLAARVPMEDEGGRPPELPSSARVLDELTSEGVAI